MKRIALFLVTNLAILLVLSIILSITGVGRMLDESGAIDVTGLLAFSAIVGFVGSFMSLAMSKWTAKRIAALRNIES